MNQSQIKDVSNFYEAVSSDPSKMYANEGKIKELIDDIKKWDKKRGLLQIKTGAEATKFKAKFTSEIYSKFTNIMDELVRADHTLDSDLMERYMDGTKDQITITFDKLNELDNEYNVYIHDPTTKKVHTIVVDTYKHPEIMGYIKEHESIMHQEMIQHGII